MIADFLVAAPHRRAAIKDFISAVVEQWFVVRPLFAREFDCLLVQEGAYSVWPFRHQSQNTDTNFPISQVYSHEEHIRYFSQQR